MYRSWDVSSYEEDYVCMNESKDQVFSARFIYLWCKTIYDQRWETTEIGSRVSADGYTEDLYISEYGRIMVISGTSRDDIPSDRMQELLADEIVGAVVNGTWHYAHGCFAPTNSDRVLLHRGFGGAYIFCTYSGNLLVTLQDLFGLVDASVFSPCGEYVAVALHDGRLGVWNARTGVQTYALPRCPGRVVQLIFSGDGTRLVVLHGIVQGQETMYCNVSLHVTVFDCDDSYRTRLSSHGPIRTYESTYFRKPRSMWMDRNLRHAPAACVSHDGTLLAVSLFNFYGTFHGAKYSGVCILSTDSGDVLHVRKFVKPLYVQFVKSIDSDWNGRALYICQEEAKNVVWSFEHERHWIDARNVLQGVRNPMPQVLIDHVLRPYFM